MKPAHRVVLAILDGWGIRAERADNAILQQGTPALDRTYPLSEVADAIRYVQAGKTRGKAVITV